MTAHIKAHWDRFVELVMPKDAPEIQITEMRNAFYAGVSMIFAEIMDKLDSPGVTEADGGAFLSEIHAEVSEFVAEKMGQGDED